MKNRLNVITIALLVFIFTSMMGCAVTDIDRTANFGKYKTFAWGEAHVNVDNPVYDSDLIDKNIKQTVEQEFAKHGIRVDNKNPDFIVSYHTYTKDKKQRTMQPYYYHPYFFPYRFYPYGWGWGMPYGYFGGAPYVYTEGTLIVDVVDAKTQDVVWRGTVSGNVDDVKKLQKQIAKGVRAIVKKYPFTPEVEPLPAMRPEGV